MWLLVAGPDGEDHGQAGHFGPLLAEIGDMVGQGSEVETQRRIADDQSGIGMVEHAGKIGRAGNEDSARRRSGVRGRCA